MGHGFPDEDGIEWVDFLYLVGAFACSAFSAKLLKSATEKRETKNHLSLSVAI